MKKKSYSLIGVLAFVASCFAQSPGAINYQAVLRNSGNVILSNKSVGVRFVIKQGSVSGTAVYTETFTTNTNALGLINLEIGKGTSSDVFANIDWGNGPYFLETAIDENGGTSYAVIGTSQFISVPYSLYSKVAESSITDNVNDADSDPSNELQAVSLSNDTLYLTKGGKVYLGKYAIDKVDDADADPSNELQAVSLSNDTLYLTNGGAVYLGKYAIDKVDDADADPKNELQVLSLSGDTIFISKGGFIVLNKKSDTSWTQVGKNMYASKLDGAVSIGTDKFLEKVNIGDSGLFRMQIGHIGNFNEPESGRLVFSEDINFGGTCGFEFHHDGAANTLSIESGCTNLGDTSIVFTRSGEVRIPERVSVGVNKNPSSDIHIEQSSAGTSPSSAGIRFYAPNTTTNFWSLWNSTNDFSFGFNGSRVSYISTAGSYTQASDRRLKSSIVPIGGVLNRVMELQPVEYVYNHDPLKHITKGFIAQDVQAVFPEMVSTTEGTDLLALPYDEFGVLAVKAIQEQQAIIESQQKQIDELIAAVERLQKIVKIDNSTVIGNAQQVPDKPVEKPADADQN